MGCVWVTCGLRINLLISAIIGVRVVCEMRSENLQVTFELGSNL